MNTPQKPAESLKVESHKSATRDFFLYLLMGGIFYFLIFDFVSLLFSYIEHMLPDVLNNGYDYFAQSIRSQLSSMMVLFPVYLGIAWYIRKDLNANPEKVEFGLRKFFIYLTLFLATVALIGDMITLVNTYLDGEITLRFMLKVVVVLVTALGAGSYIFYELKRGADSRPSKKIAIAASVIFLSTIVWGLILAGSPSNRRLYRLDMLRVSHLSQIAYTTIDQYWNGNSKLPSTIGEISKNSIYLNPVDPETGNAYEYKVLGTKQYELCANFDLETSKDPNDIQYAYNTVYNSPYVNFSEKVWEHPAGNYCYKFEIKDPTPNDGDASLHSVPIAK